MKHDKLQKDLTFEILLLASTVLLIGIGISFLYTASQPSGIKYFNNQYHFLQNQLIHLAIGLILFTIGAYIHHDIYKKYTKLFVLGIILLLIITLIPGLSPEIGGARRWIRFFGFSFQPSEFAKIVVILYLSTILDKKQNYIQDFYKGVFPPLVVIGVISFLIFMENDFSTTFLIALITIIILFAAGVRIITFLMLSILGTAASTLMVIAAPYRIKRMFAFINPWNDPLGSGWHYIQSMKSFSLGKWLGKGIGESTQKYAALPEAHNDYIFAVIAEEGGAITAILILFIFTFFAFTGLNIAKRTNNKYSYLLAIGITSLIFMQALINIGVVLSILPATGITLPFISAGGTSLIVFLFLVGVLFNIARTGNHNE